MDRIDFYASILGQNASEKLVNGHVSMAFIARPPTTRHVRIYLDDELLGETNINVSQRRVCLATALDPNISPLCGFDTAEEHEAALLRAGFRYKPLGEYYVYQITLMTIEYKADKPTIISPPTLITTEVIKEVPVIREVVKRVPVVKEVTKEVIREVPVLQTISEKQFNEFRGKIANRIVHPGKPVEVRMWQLRIATNILNFMLPYLRVELLEEVNNEQDKG